MAQPPATRDVLVIDDEPDVRNSIRDLLESELTYVRVHTAGDGVEGLRLLEEHEVDLILCDYAMPDMDGMAFLEEAARKRPRVPAIMVTAYPDPALAERAVRELGVSLLVAKPMDLDYLVALVHGALTNRGKGML